MHCMTEVSTCNVANDRSTGQSWHENHSKGPTQKSHHARPGTALAKSEKGANCINLLRIVGHCQKARKDSPCDF